jgi:hypothetical protein
VVVAQLPGLNLSLGDHCPRRFGKPLKHTSSIAPCPNSHKPPNRLAAPSHAELPAGSTTAKEPSSDAASARTGPRVHGSAVQPSSELGWRYWLRRRG